MKAIEVLFFSGFVILLVTAMIIQSIPMMVLAFLSGFLGYITCEHT